MQAPFTQPEPHFPPPGERSLMVHSASPDEGLSTLALVNALLRQRVLVVVLPILLVAGVATYELSRPRQYVSSAAFMPQGPDSRSRMSGLAAQFGIAIPAVDGGQSPSFYAELIGSREILVSLVRAQYTWKHPKFWAAWCEGVGRSDLIGEQYALTLRDNRPISVGFEKNKVKLTVHMAHLKSGEKDFENWDVTGTYNPAGRLPVTFYASAGQLPPFADYAMKGRTYRYFGGKPLFAFGHGLSYTRFDYGKPRWDATKVPANGIAK